MFCYVHSIAMSNCAHFTYLVLGMIPHAVKFDKININWDILCNIVVICINITIFS